MTGDLGVAKINSQKSAVVIGGILRLEPQYMRVLKDAHFSPRIFNASKSRLHGRMEETDVIILFAGTVSHKMAETARKVASVYRIPLVTIRPSSVSALRKSVGELRSKSDMLQVRVS